MRSVVRLTAAALALGTLGAGAALGATGTVERSIPLEPGTVQVIPGPGGGVVSVQRLALDTDNGFRTTARRPDGTLIWSRLRSPDCGNCDGGGGPLALQPDGTVGPVGFAGDDAWAYTPTGTEIAACTGVMLRGSLCVNGGAGRFAGPGILGIERPVLGAVRGGAVVWQTVLSEYTWSAEFDVPAPVVADGQGRVFAVFAGAQEDGVGPIPPRVFALDGRDGTRLWQADGPSRLVTSLGVGLLAQTGTGLVSLDGAGAMRWQRPLPVSPFPNPRAAAVDSARGRVLMDGLNRSVARAQMLDARTGRILWATPPRDRSRALAVDRAGRSYVARERGPRRGLVVLDRAGRELWRLPTTRPIVGAVPLAGGRVAVALGGTRVTGRPHLILARAPR